MPNQDALFFIILYCHVKYMYNCLLNEAKRKPSTPTPFSRRMNILYIDNSSNAYDMPIPRYILPPSLYYIYNIWPEQKLAKYRGSTVVDSDWLRNILF